MNFIRFAHWHPTPCKRLTKYVGLTFTKKKHLNLKILIHTVEITLSPKEAADENNIALAAANVEGVNPVDIAHCRVIRRSVDARKKGQIKVNLAVQLFVDERPTEEINFDYPDVTNAQPVIIVGAGPAGLFGALELIELGLKPIILERGKNVSDRKIDIATLSKNGTINSNSNYAFGEGGAGTYSDGKLYTRSKKRGPNRKALEILRFFGASENIMYDAHPHIGTDKLPRIIQAIRETIINQGGEVYFNTKVEDIIVENDVAKGVITTDGTRFEGVAVMLATGHSARDIYKMMHEKEIELETKNFAVGVRVEHPQELIDEIQYKGLKDEYLPAAAYSLVSQVGGRGVYSFCMCPGGFIVPAATQNGQCVVNGMSPSGRNNVYANAGIVTQVTNEDLEDYTKYYGVLGGMMFQEQLEQMGFAQGGGAQVAPAQRLEDFVSKRSSTSTLRTSYHPGLVTSDMHHWLPKFMSKALIGGFKEFDKKMHGFITNQAQVIGIESRTSAPVRIPRSRETLCHTQVQALFPVGEGAGYAGGIVSAAIDGMVAANAIKEYIK